MFTSVIQIWTLKLSCTPSLTRVLNKLRQKSAENLDVAIYQITESCILRMCNLLEKNKPRVTDSQYRSNLWRKEEENAVLCVNRMFSDVTTFSECNDVTDAELVNWISGTLCNVKTRWRWFTVRRLPLTSASWNVSVFGNPEFDCDIVIQIKNKKLACQFINPFAVGPVKAYTLPYWSNPQFLLFDSSIAADVDVDILLQYWLLSRTANR